MIATLIPAVLLAAQAVRGVAIRRHDEPGLSSSDDSDVVMVTSYVTVAPVPTLASNAAGNVVFVTVTDTTYILPSEGPPDTGFVGGPEASSATYLSYGASYAPYLNRTSKPTYKSKTPTATYLSYGPSHVTHLSSTGKPTHYSEVSKHPLASASMPVRGSSSLSIFLPYETPPATSKNTSVS